MDLQGLLLVLRARWRTIAALTLLAAFTAGFTAKMLPKHYMASASVVINSQYVNPVTGAQMQGMLLPAYLNTQAMILTNRTTALKVVDMLHLTDDPAYRAKYAAQPKNAGTFQEWIAQQLLSKFKVDTSDRDNIISFSYTATDPAQAARVTNAFLDAYVQTNLALKTGPAQHTAQWYAGQLKTLQAQLEQAQGKLIAYQKTHGVILTDAGVQATLPLQALVAQQALAAAQNYGDLSKAQHPGEHNANVMNDPVVQALKTNLAQAQAKLSQLAQTEGVNNPQYLSVQAEVGSLQQRLNQQIASVQSSLQNSAQISQQSMAELQSAVRTQQQRLLADNTLKAEGQFLVQQVTNAQRIYDVTLRSYQESELQSKSDQTDMSVLSRAVPPMEPTGPRALISLALGGALGLILGMALALLQEQLQRKVRSAQEVIDLTGAPLLGMVQIRPLLLR
jgi:chain length determinant protein EpsF